MDKVKLDLPKMGVGTMMWANMPGALQTDEQAYETFKSCLEHNLTFFDTAEMYGNGASEERLGRCIKKYGKEIQIADKFAPPSDIIPSAPKRKNVSEKSPEALMEALDNSLLRLGVDTIDLYQMHAPSKYNSISDYMDVMAEAYRQGKIRAVGVCNFSSAQIQEAQTALNRHGLSLSTAMVQYNLLHPTPEINGTAKICHDLDIGLIPFAPLAEGILTGKYRGDQKVPIGYAMTIYFSHLGITDKSRREIPLSKRLFSKPIELNKKKMEVLFTKMDKIAEEHGKTLAQVALNWLLSCDSTRVIPIPGIKTPKQVESNIGSLDWSMSKKERDLLSEITLQ